MTLGRKVRRTPEMMPKKVGFESTNPIIIQKFNVFYLAEDYHQDFEKKNPNHPYIRAISKPRVSKFINSYSKIIKLKK